MKYAVLLRAVNLAGRNAVPMPALRSALEAAGYADVATHLQSGNAILTTTDRAAQVAKDVRALVRKEFGVDADVMVRTHRQLAAVVDKCPFDAAAREPTKVHVVFLDGKPSAAALRGFDGAAYEPEQLVAVGSELYVFYPNGAGRARLTAALLEKTLGVRGTARNWNTVTALADKTERVTAATLASPCPGARRG